MCNVLETYNIFRKSDSCFYKYVTSVNNLISLYKSSNIKSKSLAEILRNKLSEDGIAFNYEELQSGYCLTQFYDDSGFQRVAGIRLDNIIEELEDGEHSNIKEYFEIVETIKNKFGFYRWVDLPKDDTKDIRFLSVDSKTNEISYELRDNEKKESKHGYGTMEDINLILYHPEFKFDS